MSADEPLTTGLFTGGETGRLMARLDWSRTPLGPVDDWPQSLRAAVGIVLSSRYPMLLLWGPEFTQLYNDAYSALIGDQHPRALGGDVRVTLEAGWDVLEPLISEAMATGVASWVPALQLALERAGYREEAYFSVSHAPARDDAGRTAGVLTVCSEVTEQVVGQRRLRLLRELSVGSGSVAETTERLVAAVAGHPLDVPFAAIRLSDGSVTATHPGIAPEVDPPGSLQVLDVPAGLTVPGGPWGDPVRQIVAVPLPSGESGRPLGVLVAAVSPSRGLDDDYRSFFELLGRQVSVAVRNSLAYEEERRRAEKLAELDRVKTAFFTNVSHEFRTPLTLMLGPLADALDDTGEPLGPRQRERVDVARRNATRLLTLVNNLLTFSGLEAGRAGTTPRPVDLARLTAGLAGVFRAAVERSSLRLVVDCPPLPRPTAVDPAHWETIVTNLISNALKFTFVGEIRVTLDSDDDGVRLRVSDSGIGIDPGDQAQLFDRFHRVQGARSRSHEGSGIGLALVRELSRLLGGDVTVASTPGRGSTFTVTLPWPAVATDGPAESTPLGGAALALAEEALSWTVADSPAAGDTGTRILVADDNADMRAYLMRLLADQRWQVQGVADGRAALEAVRHDPPDLLVTDVMMPGLDGFSLIRELRRDPATRALPILVLSARAGGESGAEGIDAGADDYVVKPFTAADLLARVRGALRRGRPQAPVEGSGRTAAAAATTAVIASGRALEEAVRSATDQARALLGGLRATTVLQAGPGRDALTFHSDAGDKDTRTDDAADVVVPVRSGTGENLGSLTVLLPGTSPSARAASTLEPIAVTLAALAESRWELSHERQIAATLQHSLLPPTLPALPGWELAARYRPVSGGVGGDWYDAFTLPGGDLLLSVGDVAGYGLGAAVTAAQLRNAVRAYAGEEPEPPRILDRLVAMLSRLSTPHYATVLLARLTPATGELVWCSAGHPAPVLRIPGRRAQWLRGHTSPPLGLTSATYTVNRTEMPPGAVLVAFTDGLAGDRRGDLGLGVGRLLARCDAAGDAVSAAGLIDTVVKGAADTDDVAALVVRHLPRLAAAAATAPDDIDRHWTYPLEPTASAALRRDLRAALAGPVTDDDLMQDLLIAATEAVNNAVEHAQQPTRPDVDVRLRVAGGVVHLSVRDYGTWRARPAPADRGRGALLMNAYGAVNVTSTATGTVVEIERSLTP
ncbi:SpoIIE family protein phosphatase [Symbioplanes lichenis]|uniref:SpoIIE family protein phosphatase n=1 Tax=Symbioplanes lichenis TaxID=1629072 RepID=UPI002738812B|nr:SpoIIE family protein phosphatase [Actinoplanes lichenis]